MPVSAQKQQIDPIAIEKLSHLAEHKVTQLVNKYPSLASLFATQSDSQVNSTQTPTSTPPSSKLANQTNSSRPSPLIPSIHTEEVKELFLKLKEIMTNHQLWRDQSSRLYLEQHIMDLIGFNITSQIDGDLLPVWHGKVLSLSHQRLSATDSLSQHESHLEAGLSSIRFQQQSNIQTESIKTQERFFVQYPYWLLKKYQTDPKQIAKKFKQFNWLLINPHQEKMVVGYTTGILAPSHRYGIGLSPELSRLGQFWWPGSTGETLCWLIDQVAPTGLLYG